MKLGIFMMPIHPLGRPLASLLDEDTKKIVLADRLGFDEVWVGEHYSIKTEPITAPMMFMSSLIDKTKNIKFGTGVVCLPQHHPAIVAAEAAMFDHLTKGRFLFGIGPGGAPSDFELFKVEDPKQRNEAMLEAIDMILKIWSSDPPYQIRGKYWDIHIADTVMPEFGVGYVGKPYQKPHPPIAMSAMSPHSESVRTAGRRGWSPISANFIPTSTVASHWPMYCKGCEDAGRTPSGDDWRVARNIFIAESEQEGRDHIEDPEEATYFYFDYLINLMRRAGFLHIMKPDPEVPDEDLTAEAVIKEVVIAGTADSVLDQLVALREEVGPFGTLILGALDWSGASGEREKKSMTLLAERVLPRFAEAVGTAAAAQ